MAPQTTTRHRSPLSWISASSLLSRRAIWILLVVAVSLTAERVALAGCSFPTHPTPIDIQKFTGYSGEDLLLMPDLYLTYEAGRIGFSFLRTSMPPCNGPECQSRKVPAVPDIATAPSNTVPRDLSCIAPPKSGIDSADTCSRRLCSGCKSLPSGHFSLPLRPPIVG